VNKVVKILNSSLTKKVIDELQCPGMVSVVV